MTKLLIGLLGAGVIATGGYAAATSVDADPARTVSLPGATSTGDTTTGHDDCGHDDGRHDHRRRQRHLRAVRRGRAPERPALHRRQHARAGAERGPATTTERRRRHLRPVRRGRARERSALHRRSGRRRPRRRPRRRRRQLRPRFRQRRRGRRRRRRPLRLEQRQGLAPLPTARSREAGVCESGCSLAGRAHCPHGAGEADDPAGRGRGVDHDSSRRGARARRLPHRDRAHGRRRAREGKDASAPISSCSTSGSRTAPGSTSAASCGPRRASRSSSSRRAGRRPTASSGSSSAPTTTSSSRSAPAR